MSKAEDRALEKYPVLKTVLGDTNYLPIICFIEGYHQAEKDLELTWKDMMTIDDLLDELLPPRRDNDELVLKGYYKEVLKRLKAMKEK